MIYYIPYTELFVVVERVERRNFETLALEKLRRYFNPIGLYYLSIFKIKKKKFSIPIKIKHSQWPNETWTKQWCDIVLTMIMK
jgi:hypothetical protein